MSVNLLLKRMMVNDIVKNAANFIPIDIILPLSRVVGKRIYCVWKSIPCQECKAQKRGGIIINKKQVTCERCVDHI